MYFLTDVSVPGGGSAPKPTAQPSGYQPKGSFLSRVVASSPAEQARSARLNTVTRNATQAQNEANAANSFGGKTENFIKGLWPASGIPEQFQEGVAQIKSGLPSRFGGTGDISPDVKGGQRAIQAGEGALNLGSGIITAISSPFAPALKYLGMGVNAVGGAASNIPAVQRFANTPAGETTARVAGDVANASNIAMGVVGGAEGFRSAVRGGFLERAGVAKPTEEATAPTEKPQASKPSPAAQRVRQSHEEYARSQGYEPYKPDNELPTIKMGPKGESKLPTIQMEGRSAPTRTMREDLRVEPIKETPKPPTRSVEAPARSEVPYSADRPTSRGNSPLQPVESTGPHRTSTLASKVDAKAVAEGLHAKVEDLPGYNKTNWDDQGRFATDLVNNEPDKAIRILRGEEEPPAHVLKTAVFTALEQKAIKTGDGALSLALKDSPINLATVRMGQETGYLSQRDPLSPVEHIQSVENARANSVSAKKTPAIIRREAPRVLRAVKDAAPSTDEWTKFITDLKCGY